MTREWNLPSGPASADALSNDAGWNAFEAYVSQATEAAPSNPVTHAMGHRMRSAFAKLHAVVEPGLVERLLQRITARLDATPAAKRPRATSTNQTHHVGRVIASVVLIVIAMSSALMIRSAIVAHRGPPARVYETSATQRTVINLADGSRVTLYPQSRLNVGAGFGTRSRTVSLDGAAYFEVQHAKGRAFVVNAGAVVTRVLGTSFAIRAQGDDVQVGVSEGRVSVGSAVGSDPPALLSHGVAAQLHRGRILSVRYDETFLADFLGWKRIEFTNAPFTNIATALSKMYKFHIDLFDTTLAKRRFTGFIQPGLGGHIDLWAALSRSFDTRCGGDVRLIQCGPKDVWEDARKEAVRNDPTLWVAGSGRPNARRQKPFKTSSQRSWGGKLETPISLQLTNRSIADAVQEIGRLAGLSVLLTNDVVDSKRRITMHAANMPAGDALARVLKGSSFHFAGYFNVAVVSDRAREAYGSGK